MSGRNDVKHELARLERMRATGIAVANAYSWLGSSLPLSEHGKFFANLGHRVRICNESLYLKIIRPKDDAPYVSVRNRASCKCRFCPPDERRRAYQQRKLIYALLDFIFEKHPDMRVKMLTLTLKNQPVADAAPMLEHLISSLQRLMNSPRAKSAQRGHWSSFECPVRGTSLAPEAGWHVHCLLLVDAACAYLSWEEWRSLWKAAARLHEYEPIVRIEAVHTWNAASDYDAARGAVREVAKYLCSPMSLMIKPHADDLFASPEASAISIDPHVLRHLTLATRRKRLTRFDRLWVQALKEHRRRQRAAPLFEAEASSIHPA